MFHLRFVPTFARQQKEFLKLTEAPEIKLTDELLHALTLFEENHESSEISNESVSTRTLWLLCFQLNRKLFAKSGLAASLAAVCASASTLLAIHILKMDSETSTLLALAFGYFISNSVALFANFSTNRLRAELALSTEALFVALISKKLLSLSTQAASEQSSGNLKVLITSDVKNVSEFLNNVIRNLIPSITSIIIMSPLLIHYAGKAGWFSLIVLTLILPISLGLNFINVKLQRIAQSQMDEHASLVGEWIKNIRLVRYLSWDQYFETKLKTIIRGLLKVSILQHIIACVTFGLSTTWWMVTGASVLAFAKILNAPMEISGFFGSLWLLTFIASYFTHLPNTIRVYGNAVPSMDRMVTFLQANDIAKDFEPAIKTGDLKTPMRIIFENVNFRTLKDLNVTIRLNQKAAILGEVGSGKSTFLSLICAEYKPTSGKIWVEFSDGQKHSLWQAGVRTAVRSFLAWVPQNPYVSSDTLSTNISFSELKDDSADLLNALQKAWMQEDLLQLRDGRHQMLGESGVNLSGGQRQRLNLARAFFSKRPFLVLDDTLSAVDHRTEVKLMETLSESDQGLLLVTHRLSEIKKLAYVYVFQAGQIIEQGDPVELQAKADSAFVKALEAYTDV